MFRVRRIFDDVLPVNRASIAEVQQILAEQFPGVSTEEIAALPARLHNPFAKRFRTILYVAENGRRKVLGFALVLHEPEIHFCYLDYLATARGVTGRGIGAALYEHIRDEAHGLGAAGLFFECLPDEPDLCPNPVVREANARRLKFYERYGARPIVGTLYESAIDGEGYENLPHLVYDGLDGGESPPRAAYVREVIRAILERKYGHLCPPEYVEKVVASVTDDPVRLREYRYIKKAPPPRPARPRFRRMVMVVNDRHHIHHVREKGYVESPTRIKAIDGELILAGLAEPVPPQHYDESHITAVHDAALVEYLRTACHDVPEGKSVYPYVFPVRNPTRLPKEQSVLAGYFCIDTFTPINRNAYPAARRAVECALTAAESVLAGRRVAYALVRPPGHHAERRLFGGFCYFNNAAVAAHRLAAGGKRVAIVDVDYHHGNGQQDIFYTRDDVFTVSIHGDPSFAYPYFTGFTDERGEGRGLGYNLNLPQPEKLDGGGYRRALAEALSAVVDFKPDYLVVALGLDPAKGDPTGTWSLAARDFEANGRMLGELALPTLVVQEGGYRTRTLGTNARHFFQGLLEGTHEP
jgi:acetoin utilization deacetylase AcuC-like enzyme/GNAT superfamily N-acetyltransferase